MTINWPLITVLFFLSLPGSIIAMKRLIYFLLPNNTEELKKRFSAFAIIQALMMVLVMSFAGAVLSPQTGFNAPVFEALLLGKAGINSVGAVLLPALIYSFVGLIFFCILYYGVIGRILDKKNLRIMNNLRLALGLDGCVLYGGVAEEVIARWGLMNLTSFFILLFVKQNSLWVIWPSIILSGLIFAMGQIPAYIAAGCTSSRRFIYSCVLLIMFQSILFGFLFWQYGLVCSILAHMLFHIGWAVYDFKFGNNVKNL